ncbi:putative flippase GtrA [Stenotrophomonas rhizophila]|jgi:putative flippase GtrA|uniref:Flippase GtrA n=1 Tax=Stenotrophomonas rhizophila TaxID=216778 RepID=A0AAP5EEU6_9GAMM|nr:GtrA family protein [Stenotrophomonas rhizophila]MDQ1109921.1 putative flippase GtrA [Stenotrophomonas rhizophila]
MTLPRLSELYANEKLRFLAVGGWNTLVGYLVFVLFHITLEARWGVMMTLVASYCVALPHSFLTQRLVVFRSQRHWFPEFGRFVISNSSIFIANLLLLPLAKVLTGANTALLQAAFLVVSTVASYLVHKHFTFSR